jgi:hypothetical protein
MLRLNARFGTSEEELLDAFVTEGLDQRLIL